jgi:hypothetical protein
VTRVTLDATKVLHTHTQLRSRDSPRKADLMPRMHPDASVAGDRTGSGPVVGPDDRV